MKTQSSYQENEDFSVNNPYGILIDYSNKKYSFFNRNYGVLGCSSVCDFNDFYATIFNENVVDIPKSIGVVHYDNYPRINHTAIFFYLDKTNPYTDDKIDSDLYESYKRIVIDIDLVLKKTNQ